MTQAQWQRVRDVFERALDRNPSDVTAWLDIETGDDQEVRAEIESLVAHHVRAGQFLEVPIGDRLAELMPEPEEVLIPGQVLGPYTVQAEIGRGGMGRVYRAVDTRLGRMVALKALSPQWVGDVVQRERLRREARVAAALNHPGVCTVYALEELDGTLFIATELVEGHTLREEIARGKRPSPHEAMATARELTSALGAAHAAGLVHRDFKPENVMRARDGRLKILDFGLARSTQVDGTFGAPVTAVASIVGTPACMAPEQLTNQHVDQRADVFALGVFMYEYVTGTHPFEASTPFAMIGRILESTPVRVEERAPSIPRVLAAVIERSLQKRPADRYASAGEVLRVLDDNISGPVEPRAVVPGTRIDGWWRNHQIVVVALYLVASALAWQIKEWYGGLALSAFVVVSVGSAIAGILRGHLLFTAAVHPTHLYGERRRVDPVTLITDVLLAVALVVDGGWFAVETRPVAGVLTIALGIGLGLTRLVVEPATTRAAFE